MISGWPSPSRSVVTTEVRARLGLVGRPVRFAGRVGVGIGVGAGMAVGEPKVPSALPGRIWAWVVEVVTTASSLPDEMKLPRVPVMAGWPAENASEVWR